MSILAVKPQKVALSNGSAWVDADINCPLLPGDQISFATAAGVIKSKVVEDGQDKTALYRLEITKGTAEQLHGIMNDVLIRENPWPALPFWRKDGSFAEGSSHPVAAD